MGKEIFTILRSKLCLSKAMIFHNLIFLVLIDHAVSAV